MSTQAQLLDRTTALERLEGDEELLNEIIVIFLEDAPRLFLALKQSRVDKDQKSTERQAHSLKGASANVGATVLQDISMRAEVMIREGDWTGLENLLPEMERTLHGTLDLLREQIQ
jgi:two-component system, sensor histidine kinase and response regulator